MMTQIDRNVQIIGVVSLGCSKNRVNTEQMMYLLRQAGYFISGETDGADVVLLNTCGFIESAKSEAVEYILEFAAAKKEGRIGKLVVAGCLPERYQKDIKQELPEIDAVVGTGSFDDIVDVIRSLEKTGGQSPCLGFFGDINAPVSETGRIISTSSVWAYIKIAEGCDNRCAYCCIPDIRGKYRSRPLEKIVEEARKLAHEGFRELIIVAQDITRYGLDLYGEVRLHKLLEALNSIDELKWIRLHYMYPDGFKNELIDVIAKSDKILKYLDIPIQHINDGILQKMNRRGTKNDIKKLFKKLRERIPGVVLRTSLITGLPGEGEKEFNELCEFLKSTKIERVGVFAYSPEEGTAAALMERPSIETAEQRVDDLMELQSLILLEWNKSRIGSVVTVLLDDNGPESYEPQYPEEYHPARSYAESPEIDGVILVKSPKINTKTPCLTFVDVKITGIENGQLVGEVYKYSK